jgi:hypothetical protein
MGTLVDDPTIRPTNIRRLQGALVNQPFGAPEEFPTNLTLLIEYRIGGCDLNLFCASELRTS